MLLAPSFSYLYITPQHTFFFSLFAKKILYFMLFKTSRLTNLQGENAITGGNESGQVRLYLKQAWLIYLTWKAFFFIKARPCPFNNLERLIRSLKHKLVAILSFQVIVSPINKKSPMTLLISTNLPLHSIKHQTLRMYLGVGLQRIRERREIFYFYIELSNVYKNRFLFFGQHL